MIVHNVRVDCKEGDPYYRFLMSDLHLGAANSDHEAIKRDLERAKEVGAKIIINGDVFDAIACTDKRYDAEVLHPSLNGEKDLAGAVVDLAFGLLFPYRSIIDVVGIGNHEETWIKHYHSDPVRMLLNRLNQEGGNIRHGSFWGYIVTRFHVGTLRRPPSHKLLYYHGSGGDSPVTKGTIDVNRRGRNWQYDALTFGHKHNLMVTADQIADVQGGRYVERTQLSLQTASYFRNYHQTTESDPLAYSYAASKAHPPKPVGGIFLVLRPVNEDGRWRVRQDYASDIFTKRKAS